MIALGQGAMSALKKGCAGLVIALVLAEVLVQGVKAPVHACCYDPPEDDSASEQSSAPPPEQADAPSAPSAPSVSAASPPVQEASSSGADEEAPSSAPRFALISQMMAEGRYLRARQLAESRLKTRPYDHHLWGLLEQIYQKLGLQGRTADAAFQVKITDPDWRPPVSPSLPASAQKRYVAKLLQAVREFKPID